MAKGPWWRRAVIYQVYVRSFADSNGDGMGDLAGVRSRLPYLEDLGVDAIWLNPFYPSPQADAGYDVADYRGVDPMFGTLADFDELVGDVHRHGLKVIVDLVPNHTSRAPLRSPPHWQPTPTAPSSALCLPRRSGPRQQRAAQRLGQRFGGPAWHHVIERDGTRTWTSPSPPSSPT